MKRVTISLSDAALERLNLMAKAEKRSRSAQLEVLIEALPAIGQPQPHPAIKRAKKAGRALA